MKHNNSHLKSCNFGYKSVNQGSEMETITSNNKINNSSKKLLDLFIKKIIIKFFSVIMVNIFMKEINNCNQKKKKISKYKQANIKFSFTNNYSNCAIKLLQKYEQKYTFYPNINDKYRTDLSFQQHQNFFVNLYKKEVIC